MGTYNYSARELANEIGNLLNNLEGDFTLDELKKALRFVAAEHRAQRTDCHRCVGKGYFIIGSDECKCPDCDGSGIRR